MPDALRPFVLALVLLNLVFVHLTGIVGAQWLLPLYALTVLSPLLQRLQHGLLYRLGWNGAVVVVSLLLVHHALTTGLLHMLEDGLALAAVCQVHVLNNSGGRQKPDLLFFNSFLIVFVTGFFCQDGAWSLVFLAYAALLLPALQLLTVLRDGRPPAPGLVRAVLRDSVPRTILVLAVATAVFLFWPRDFEREGWLESRMDLGGTQVAVGFAEEVRIDRAGRTTQSDEEVLRVLVRQGDPATVPTYWRGATFVDFRRSGWVPEPPPGPPGDATFDQGWTADGDGWRRAASGQAPAALLEVVLRDTRSQRVFLPLVAADVAAADGAEGPAARRWKPRPDGTFTFSAPRGQAPGPLLYRVATTELPGTMPRIQRRALRRLTFVDGDLLPGEIEDLARLLLARLPAHADEAQVTEAFRAWLSQNRRYALPGERGAARGIAEFLAGSAGGHCEYFATTLALMLRCAGVPCRLVTGYLTAEWDPTGRELIARRRHAHAWVEALLPGRGWVTVDPTPAADLAAAPPGESTWDRLVADAAALWRQVTGFDQGARTAALEWLAGVPAALLAIPGQQPWLLALVLALLVAWWRVRRPVEPRVVRQLRIALRRLGLRPLPGETPRESLARAAAAGLPGTRLAALAAAVDAHELLRYGGPRPGGTS